MIAKENYFFDMEKNKLKSGKEHSISLDDTSEKVLQTEIERGKRSGKRKLKDVVKGRIREQKFKPLTREEIYERY